MRLIYAIGGQYNSTVDSQDSIMDTWIRIKLHFYRSLYHSIPSRLISIVENLRKLTYYLVSMDRLNGLCKTISCLHSCFFAPFFIFKSHLSKVFAD